MATTGEISQITTIHGETYDLKDKIARTDVSSVNTRIDNLKYAGSSSQGGSATSAVKLDTKCSIDGIEFDGSSSIFHYAVCSTAAGTANKTVTCDNFKLETGAWIAVKFTVKNTASHSGLTLNVNNTGAKGIRWRNNTLSPTLYVLDANKILLFVYDGAYWQIIGDLNDNDRSSLKTRIYTGTAGVFPLSLCGLDNAQRMQSFTTTGGTSTSKAFNTSAKFMYPPTIMLYGLDSRATNGSVIPNNVLYEQHPSVDLCYSCNITTSNGFVKYKPVYIECMFDENGYWSPTSNGLTQTFISGKYYILLGCMYDTSVYMLTLFVNHPAFYYDGTNLNCIVYTADEKTKLAGITAGATKVESSSSNGKIKINGTDTTVYTHPTYTSKTSGLYKITVDGTGHVSDTASVSASDLPSHTHDAYVLKSGDTMTGSLTFGSTGLGIKSKDSTGFIYTLISDNGTNMWIGSGQSATTHHTGKTYISTGYNSNTSTGNDTIYVSVPNASNDDATNYGIMHFGNTSVTTTGTGNAITSLSLSSGVFTVTKGTSFLPLTGGTLTGPLIIKGTASSHPLVVRGISGYGGSDGNGDTPGPLFLNIDTSQPTYFGGTTYKISGDGSKYNGESAGLTPIELNSSSALSSKSGTFAFYGTNNIISGYDMIGIQLGYSGDKIQISSIDNNLIFRQNEYGGTDSSHWRDWKSLLSTDSVVAGSGLTVTQGSPITSLYNNNPIYQNITIAHTNSVSEVTTLGLLKIKYDSEGHITESSSVTASDLPSHTHSEYVLKAGDTMLGTLNFTTDTMNGVGNSSQFGDDSSLTGTMVIRGVNGYTNLNLKYASNSNYQDRMYLSVTTPTVTNRTFLSIYEGNKNGTGISISAGGLTMIGSGESNYNLYERITTTDTNPWGTTAWDATTEQMVIASDNDITFVTGANGLSSTTYTDWTDLCTVKLDGYGNFFPSVTGKGSIGGSARYWNTGYIKRIFSDHVTSKYIDGNNNGAIINSQAPAGSYVMLSKMNSTNGVYTMGVHGTDYELIYTTNTLIEEGTNSFTHRWYVAENGDTTLPNNVIAPNFVGKLKQISSTRLTSANISTSATPSVQMFLSSSSMRTGKPHEDGYILHFDWDTYDNWQSQLFIPIRKNVSPQYRPQGNTDWDNSGWINILTDKFGVGKSNFISFPEDGTYITASSSDSFKTGALVITLPFGFSDIMLNFTVDIYNHSTGTSCSYRISGTASTNNNWSNASALCEGIYGDTITNLNVYFGYNGSKVQIQIGETNTVWKYPNVWVRDIELGYNSSYDKSFNNTNRKNWSVSFVTSNISNISQTVTNTNIAYRSYVSDKVKTTLKDTTSYTSYYIPWVENYTSSTDIDLMTNDGFAYRHFNGTASAVGESILVLGNETATGTAGNKRGAIRIYSTSSAYTQLQSDGNYLKFLHSASTAGAGIVPQTTHRYDLGMNTLRWRRMYLSGSLFMYNGTGTYRSVIKASTSLTEDVEQVLPNKTGTIALTSDCAVLLASISDSSTQSFTGINTSGYDFFIVKIWQGASAMNFTCSLGSSGYAIISGGTLIPNGFINIKTNIPSGTNVTCSFTFTGSNGTVYDETNIYLDSIWGYRGNTL